MNGSVTADVMAYFKSVPAERRERMLSLHAMILDAVPGVAVDMGYRMPTYRRGEGWVAMANQKHHISLYTCGYHHIQPFRERNPGVKTGKGCINLRDRDQVPMEDLIQVVRHAIEHPKPG